MISSIRRDLRIAHVTAVLVEIGTRRSEMLVPFRSQTRHSDDLSMAIVDALNKEWPNESL